MPRRVSHLPVVERRCATRLQTVADTLAALCVALIRQAARGEPIDAPLVQSSHANACETLATAHRHPAPIEPELFAALACLQAQEEAVRELLS